jgi:hypothetical protein
VGADVHRYGYHLFSAGVRAPGLPAVDDLRGAGRRERSSASERRALPSDCEAEAKP